MKPQNTHSSEQITDQYTPANPLKKSSSQLELMLEGERLGHYVTTGKERGSYGTVTRAKFQVNPHHPKASALENFTIQESVAIKKIHVKYLFIFKEIIKYGFAKENCNFLSQHYKNCICYFEQEGRPQNTHHLCLIKDNKTWILKEIDTDMVALIKSRINIYNDEIYDTYFRDIFQEDFDEMRKISSNNDSKDL